MPDSPFASGCVVLVEGSGGTAGLVFKSTPRTAFGCSYSSLYWAKLEENGEVTITFSHHIVKLKGKRLETVVEGIAEQKVREVRVATRAETLSLEDASPIVERILIEETGKSGG